MSHEIVFSGRLRDGFSIDTVRANFSQMFRVTNPAALDRMFSGVTIVLKRDVVPENAKPLLAKLFEAGAVGEVRATAAAPAPTVPAPATPAPAPSAPAARDSATGAATIAPSVAPPRPQPAARAVFSAGLSLVPQEDASTDQTTPPNVAPSRTPIAPLQAKPNLRNPPAPEPSEVDSPLPVPESGLCWGGFFAPLIWGSFNGMKLSFVPLLGIRFLRYVLPVWTWMLFYLAFGAFYLFKGRELAWAHKDWDDVEHFNRIQRRWTIAGIPLFLLFMYGMIHLMQVDRLAARQTAALAALDAAVASQDHAAISRAREDYVQTIADPRERESMRQEYAEQDRAEQEAADEEKAAELEAAGHGDSGTETESTNSE